MTAVTGRDFPAVSVVTGWDFPAETFLTCGNVKNNSVGGGKNVLVSTSGLSIFGISIF